MDYLAATIKYTVSVGSQEVVDFLMGPFFAFFVALMIICGAIAILCIVAMWKLFEKADRPGWYAIVPFLNMYTITEISGQNGWLFLLNLIPGIGSMIWIIMVAIKLAPAFGKDTSYAIGIIFLSPIFLSILAFGDAKYQYGTTPAAPAQPQQPQQPQGGWTAGN